jgi:hypothetical protein
MHVLVVGAGDIGGVYGAHLGAADHRISVLAHGERTAAIAVRGLHVWDITSGIETQAPATAVPLALAVGQEDKPVRRCRARYGGSLGDLDMAAIGPGANPAQTGRRAPPLVAAASTAGWSA